MRGPRGKILVEETLTEALQIVTGNPDGTAQTSREDPAKVAERIANGD
jgi:hypothetical protein